MKKPYWNSIEFCSPRPTQNLKESTKCENIIIREVHADGTSFVRLTPVAAEDTSNAMRQLIYAYMDARDDTAINQLLLIPCFILDFLSIHPFSDGNGRMSRLLSLLLLYCIRPDLNALCMFPLKSR